MRRLAIVKSLQSSAKGLNNRRPWRIWFGGIVVVHNPVEHAARPHGPRLATDLGGSPREKSDPHAYR